MAKNLFIAGISKDAGKSTISLAVIDKLLKMNKKVGFMKPVGQRWLSSRWGKVEEDVILMKQIFNFEESPKDMNPIVVKKGFTEDYLSRIVKPDLTTKILDAYRNVSKGKEYVIIEGTGDAGVGSVIDKSNAEVAKLLNADVVLVGKGGIGSAIDKLELNRRFFESHGAHVIGVIVNKVIKDKVEKVRENIKRYCKKYNLKMYGCIPYSPILSHPTLGQVIEQLKPEIIYETDDRKTILDKFVIGASRVEEFVEYLGEKSGNLMLIFPAVRIDLIFAIPNLKHLFNNPQTRIHSILFCGKQKPTKIEIQILQKENINILLKKGDTFSTISKLNAISIKTGPYDKNKIEEIKKIVTENIQYIDIFNLLKEQHIEDPFGNTMKNIVNKVMRNVKRML